MKNIAQQSAGYREKVQFLPAFIAVILKNIENAFQKQPPEGESSSGGC